MTSTESPAAVLHGPASYGDETSSSYVIAGDHIHLGHHGTPGPDVAAQVAGTFDALRRTLQSVGADLCDLVSVTLYLRSITDFRAARDVFSDYFEPGRAPARMAATTEFVDPERLCQITGVAYRGSR